MLLPVVVTNDGMRREQAVRVPFPQPSWIRSFYGSERQRLGLMLVADITGLSLHGLTHDATIAASAAALAKWQWRLFGIDAHMDREDNIHGVVVGQELSGSQGAPVMSCRWSLDYRGRFRVEAPVTWQGLDADELDHFQVGVNSKGEPSALVHSSSKGWLCLFSGRSQSAEAPPGATVGGLPILRFIADGTVPIVLWHDVNRGLIGTPIGKELADYEGEDFVEPELDPEYQMGE